MSLTQIHDPVMFAIPVFVVFVVLEIVAIHVLHHDQFALGGGRRQRRCAATRRPTPAPA